MKTNTSNTPNIIPAPQHWQMGSGHFELNSATQIVTEAALVELAQLFAASIAPALGFKPAVVTQPEPTANRLSFQLAADLEQLGPEGYRLNVEQDQIVLKAATPAGIFYGTQTLRQLLPESIFSPEPVPGAKWLIPAIEIEDAPRFAWRGAMLDTGRHFMPLEFIYRFIDLLALHKLNTFHWHLTEDQGWRIEIKRYPRLTEIGAWRKQTLRGHLSANRTAPQFDGQPHGGFYTQAEIRAVVAYAQQRFITIIPEIEMPGHAQAAIAAYPELGNVDQPLEVSTTWGVHHHVCNVEESTIEFMQNVLSEVLELFPSQFIHIGGDEVPTEEWRASPAAQKRIEELGLKDESQLQGYFLRRIDDFLNAQGRRLIGWDEILEDELSPQAAIMSWRCNGTEITAANAGRDTIVAPYDHLYLDFYQLRDREQQPLAIGGYTPLSKVYWFEPASPAITEANRSHILGLQSQLWTEYMPTPAQVEYMAFPRLCAVAELAWTRPERKDYAAFLRHLAHHQGRLDQLQVNACPEHE